MDRRIQQNGFHLRDRCPQGVPLLSARRVLRGPFAFTKAGSIAISQGLPYISRQPPYRLLQRGTKLGLGCSGVFISLFPPATNPISADFKTSQELPFQSDIAHSLYLLWLKRLLRIHNYPILANRNSSEYAPAIAPSRSYYHGPCVE